MECRGDGLDEAAHIAAALALLDEDESDPRRAPPFWPPPTTLNNNNNNPLWPPQQHHQQQHYHQHPPLLNNNNNNNSVWANNNNHVKMHDKGGVPWQVSQHFASLDVNTDFDFLTQVRTTLNIIDHYFYLLRRFKLIPCNQFLVTF
jgi:hypothetical protein